ncbi:hypothetical protein HRH25_09955 [Flavisolibacter sp. BT320]|nr:hypothetical protein [Flavisolibacter longurius]
MQIKFIRTVLLLLCFLPKTIFSQVYPASHPGPDSEFASLSQKLKLSTFDSANPFNRELLQMISFLKKKTDLPFAVYQSKEGPILSHPSFGLIINPFEIKNIFEKFDNSTALHVILPLVLCHEVAHQKQFAFYSADAFNQLSFEQKRIYECQADILAGYYFGRFFWEDEKDESVIANYLSRLIQTDVNQATLTAAHPKKVQRITAFMAGFRLSKLETIPYNPDNILHTNKVRFLYYDLHKKEQDDVMDWSKDYARLIVNACTKYSKNIELVKQKISYKFREGHPVASYRLSYYNNSNDTVKLSFFVKCVHATGTNNNTSWNEPYYKTSDSRFHSILLEPKKTVEVKGELLGELNADDNEVVFPPDERQLIAMHRDSVPCDAADPEKRSFAFGFDSPANRFPPGFAAALGVIVEALRSDPDKIIQGPGINNGKETVFHSQFELPQANSSQVVVNERGGIIYTSTFNAKAKEGNRFTRQRARGDEELAAFRSKLNDIESTLERLSIPYKRYEVFAELNYKINYQLPEANMDLSLWLRTHPESGEREICLTVSRTVR